VLPELIRQLPAGLACAEGAKSNTGLRVFQFPPPCEIDGNSASDLGNSRKQNVRIPLVYDHVDFGMHPANAIVDNEYNLLAYRHSMKATHHRATRHSFVTDIAITNVNSEKKILARTADLSLFGCFVTTKTPFPRGTTVSIRISRGAAHIVALGRVAFSRADEGMGIVFGKIEPSEQAILEKWLDQLRNN
jgi:hypothetical protein